MQALLLHGWGIRRTIWDVKPLWQEEFEAVISPCLYEEARKTHDFGFHSIAQQLSETIKSDTVIIAWSIGGLIALPLAKLSKHVKAIIFIASSPCFLNKQGWSNVINLNDIYELQLGLQQHPENTLQYFAGLVSNGEAKPKEVNKTIREHLANKEDKAILSLWLEQLRVTDIRSSLSAIDIPVLMLLAENDGLVKVDIKHDLTSLNQNVKIQIIKDCGHAPFLSKPKQVLELIHHFIHNKRLNY